MRTTRNTETNRPSDALVWHQMSAESAAQRLNSDLERIRAAGAKLFLLPKYNPDLSPIEQVFAKLKTLLRRAARRTTDAIWRQFGKLLSAFSPQECANYFRNAGYASK